MLANFNSISLEYYGAMFYNAGRLKELFSIGRVTRPICFQPDRVCKAAGYFPVKILTPTQLLEIET